jgi:hypothetical protein
MLKNKSISINGMAVVSIDEDSRVSNIQFLPNDEFTPILEQGSKTYGQLQMLRNATFDYVANKPRVRANSTLLRKAAHGRISATRDEAYQLTLKVFKREGLDVRQTMMREAVELLNNVTF